MANITKQKRDEMLAFLEQLKADHNDDASIRAFNEIQNHLTEKKFGLVFEEHTEEVDEKLLTHIPVLCADKDRRLCKDESKPWNFLIEGDNLQALYLLDKTHRGQVDCIYIDPPYNTGAKDWKYNNDYVDGQDVYRHSKWLSMMQCRLMFAKRLLNNDTGVLIVTIDEHEVHHLRTMLEELFPNFYIQMVTAVINPKGVTQGRFSRVEEYIIYCFAPNAFVADSEDNLLNPPDRKRKPRWKGLLRSGTDALRADRESMFYPVLIDPSNQMVVRAGDYLPLSQTPNIAEKVDGYDVAWPIRKDGSFGRWSVGSETLNELIKKGYVSCGKYDVKRQTYGISYISQPNQKKIENGTIKIVGRNATTGVVEIEYASDDTRVIKTVWHRSYHDAGAYGSDMITDILGQSRAFSFPKSLYSTKDALNAVLRNNKNAIIVDFFAGSGTTLNAVNLMNEEDNGNRKCIIVTNNECSEAEEKELSSQGFAPGDDEWEKHGVCRAVTWPRTKYSINGCRDDGSMLEGEYVINRFKSTEKSRNYVHIGFMPNIAEMKLPLKKKFISLVTGKTIPQSLIKMDSKFIVSDDEKHTSSILIDASAVDEWISALDGMEHITDLYIVVEKAKIFNEIKDLVSEAIGSITVEEQMTIPMSQGFNCNVKYFKCDWTPRKPEDYLLSNALCLHIREMIELQNHIEIDNKKYVLILNKSDFNKYVMDPEAYEQIEQIWVNQSIVLNSEELKLLRAKGFKYIPREYFGQELREAAE